MMITAPRISDERLTYLANQYRCHRMDDYGFTFLAYVNDTNTLSELTGALEFRPLLEAQRDVMLRLGHSKIMHLRHVPPTLLTPVKPRRRGAVSFSVIKGGLSHVAT